MEFPLHQVHYPCCCMSLFCSRFPPVFRSASCKRGTSAKPRSSVFSPAPGAGTSRLEINFENAIHVLKVNKSSPRLAARDGMEQGPYEFQRTRPRLHRSQRVRRRTEKSATQPFLASKNLNQVVAAALLRCLAVRLRCKFFSPAQRPRAVFL